MAVIRFNFEGKNYVLGFNRKTVKQMENEGFNFDDMGIKPLTCVSDLFAGAFKMNHRFEKREVIERIHANIRDKDKITEKLVQMYSDTIKSLMADDDSEENENLIDWSMDEQKAMLLSHIRKYLMKTFRFTYLQG